MKSRSGIGAFGIVTVALVALVFGALGGAVAARQSSSTKIVKQIVNSGSPSTTVSNNSTSLSSPLSWTVVARRAGPAVVTIINQQQSQTDLFGNPVPGGTAEGSGFIIDRKGDIVTNNHVVSQAQSLNVVFSNGRKAAARLVRADPSMDLAVIKVAGAVPAVLSFGKSAQLQPGEPVLAIGSALGEFRNSVTSGVVSATGRQITEQTGAVLTGMIQTDAAINQGNSGGPLLNERGEVVGVNTAITRGTAQTGLFGQSQSVVAEGLGFAIPSATVKNVAARLVQNKPPAFLGVKYHQITSQISTYYNLPIGAYINEVAPNSPAAKAGLLPRDIITKLDGKSLTGNLDLQQIVGAHSPNDRIKISIWRSGKIRELVVKLTAQSPALK